jgi:hypothetical protein
MSFQYHISNIAELETAGQGRPMNPGEHACKVTEVRDPKPKVIQVWCQGRLCDASVRSVMVRFARIDEPDQTVVDFVSLPDTLSPTDADRYFQGASYEKDQHPNFHFRKAASFLDKLGFPLIGGKFPDRAWDPASWQGLDVILTAQEEKRRETNASQVMDGVAEQQGPRIGVKLFSYKLTPAGLKRQAEQLRKEQAAAELDEIPF